VPLCAVISKNGDILGDSLVGENVKCETSNGIRKTEIIRQIRENGERRKVISKQDDISAASELCQE
jgi:hypothetical protein